MDDRRLERRLQTVILWSGESMRQYAMFIALFVLAGLSGCDDDCHCRTFIQHDSNAPVAEVYSASNRIVIPTISNSNPSVNSKEDLEALKAECIRMREYMKTHFVMAVPGAVSTSLDRPHGLTAIWRNASEPLPKVVDKWIGFWESNQHPGMTGELKCDVSEPSTRHWTAVFTTNFRLTYTHEINLEGRSGIGKILFVGKCSLGEKDGEFVWTGEATPTEFTGTYSGHGDTGTFRMMRKIP